MKFTLPLLIASILLSGCSLSFPASRNAGINVESTPQANVYIDNQHVGNTPLTNDKIKPGEHNLKLVSLTDSTQVFEATINLKPEVMMAINRIFAQTPQESQGYLLDLEKINSRDQSEITIISTPANVIVRLDDQPKGFAPLLNVRINPGEHKITLNAQGYKPLEIVTEIKSGYRLIVSAELGKHYPLKPDQSTLSATPSAVINSTPPSVPPSPSPKTPPSPSPTPKPVSVASPSATIPPKPYVEILPTATGWLRVRSEPNGLVENEIAKVNSGTSYPYIDFNDSGWYKIEYQPGKQGWIASQYAKLYQ